MRSQPPPVPAASDSLPLGDPGLSPRRWRGLWDRRHEYRRWLLIELALALPPTVIVLIAFFATQGLTGQRILFASLAASAFLIYRDPRHRMNSVRVMVIGQLIGCVVGVLSATLLGSGYAAGAAAMVTTITVLIVLNLVHPPAVATALGFAFITPTAKPLSIFLLTLALVAALAILQRVAVWTLKRLEARWDITRL